jgi:hypothetical protein
MTIGDVSQVKPDQLSGFSTFLKNLRCLSAIGLTFSISLTTLAEEIGLDNAPPTVIPMGRMDNLRAGERADKHREMRDEWQKMPPEERAERRKAMREHWEKMPPEERSEMRRKMKEHWIKMPPEEREARRKAMREHWEKMSPEERDQFKRDMGKQDRK